MNINDHRLVGVLAAGMALALAACGSGESGDDASSATAGSGTDRAFASAMIPHH